MRILIWNLKGGQGKSSIAVQFCLMKGYYIVTNDPITPLDKIIDKKRVLKLSNNDSLPVLPDNINVVFDFGGFADQRLIKLFEQIDFCILPIIIENESTFEIQGLLESINELNRYISDNKIIVVFNKIDKKSLSLVDDVKNLLIDKFSDKSFKSFLIKKSTSFSKSIKSKKSIEELCNNPLFRHHYKVLLGQLNELFSHLENN